MVRKRRIWMKNKKRKGRTVRNKEKRKEKENEWKERQRERDRESIVKRKRCGEVIQKRGKMREIKSLQWRWGLWLKMYK